MGSMRGLAKMSSIWALGGKLGERESAEIVRALYRNLPTGAAVMLFAAAVTGGSLLYMEPERLPTVSAWMVLCLLVLAGQIAIWTAHHRASEIREHWRTWRAWLFAACMADGLRWGLATLTLAAPGAADQQVWVCMICGGAVCASVASWGVYTPVYLAMMLPAMVPYIVWAAFIPDPRYWGVAMLGMILTASIAWLSVRQTRAFGEAVRLRFENQDLAERLGEQKAAAEQANLAKSRFLAAASHDLRQPVHALGLFVASLAHTRLDRQGRKLAGQIEATVDAIDSLFESLLDISQLDAGMVRAELRPVGIGPLIARLVEEHAQDGSVHLARSPSSAVVMTDPVLLERILRNLISNAVRHAGRGRVLVACRRRGARLWVEVRDTGPGIPFELQARVFEEYFQIDNPERDRRKGLGLGLAISRRLAALLDCPLELSSRPGNGSVFRIGLIPTDEAEAEASDRPMAAPSLGGVVYLIDDDALGRDSAARLLAAWGFDPVAGESVEAVLTEARGRAPDLVVCDWRLRGGELAPEALRRLYVRLGHEPPTLLVTGDIAPDQLKHVHATGYPLLHKPVPPAKLRAAINRLRLGPRGE